jgi:hypothetical protein
MTSLYAAVSPVVHAAGTELATGRWTFSRTDLAAAAELVPRLQWPADIIDPINQGVRSEDRLRWFKDAVVSLAATAPKIDGHLGEVLRQCSALLAPGLDLRVEDCRSREDLTEPGPLMDAELAIGQVQVLLVAGATRDVTP